MAEVNSSIKNQLDWENEIDLEEWMVKNPPPKSINPDLMTEEELRAKLERSRLQILRGETYTLDEVKAGFPISLEEYRKRTLEKYFPHYYETSVEELRQELQEACRDSNFIQWESLEEIDAQLREKYNMEE